MRTAAPDVQDLRPHLAGTLATLTVPQGYTLSVAGTFAITSHRYGSPLLVEAWGFVAGAVVAFLALATLSGRHLERPAERPRATRATFNFVPDLGPARGRARGAGPSGALDRHRCPHASRGWRVGGRRRDRAGRFHARRHVPGGDRGRRHPESRGGPGRLPRSASRDLHGPGGGIGWVDGVGGQSEGSRRADRHRPGRTFRPRLDTAPRRSGHEAARCCRCSASPSRPRCR
jgi:hypothetical protein